LGARGRDPGLAHPARRVQLLHASTPAAIHAPGMAASDWVLDLELGAQRSRDGA
jgi:hypothetical protein